MKQNDKTLNLRLNKEMLLTGKIPRNTSNGNQNPAQLPRPQQEILVICPSNSDARLNLVSVGMVVTRGNPDINAQLILFYIIYIKYNHKLLAKVKKPIIP